MSKKNPDFQKSLLYRFKRWVELGNTGREYFYNQEETFDLGKERALPFDPSKVFIPPREGNEELEAKQLARFRKLNAVVSVIVCLFMAFILLVTVSNLPGFGLSDNPGSNEVVEKYILDGIEDGGAVNLVGNIILDYRAFDTFGESCVLFIAGTCVFIMLRVDDEKKKKLLASMDAKEDAGKDIILRSVARFLTPCVLLFGVYILLNGHLSPGGGFSGGAIMGASLILYLNAFDFPHIQRFFTEKIYKRITCTALVFYCFAKSYSFFTGANHIHSIIPNGVPGNLISSGLILPLNIAVGFVVTVTMYAFYALFRKGGL